MSNSATTTAATQEMEEQIIQKAVEQMRGLRLPIILAGVGTSMVLLVFFTLYDLLSLPRWMTDALTTGLLVLGLILIIAFSHRKYRSLPEYLRLLGTCRWNMTEIHSRRPLAKGMKERLMKLEKQIGWSNYLRLGVRHFPSYLGEPERLVRVLERLFRRYPQAIAALAAYQPLTAATLNRLNQDRLISPLLIHLLRLQSWAAAQQGWPEARIRQELGSPALAEKLTLAVAQHTPLPQTPLVLSLNRLVAWMQRFYPLGMGLETLVFFIGLTGIQVGQLPQWVYSLTLLFGLLSLATFIVLARMLGRPYLKSRRELWLAIGWLASSVLLIAILAGIGVSQMGMELA